MYKKTGGFKSAINDFNQLNLKDIKKYDNGAITGVMCDGTVINLHQSHTDDMKWTLEKGYQKIRYEE